MREVENDEAQKDLAAKPLIDSAKLRPIGKKGKGSKAAKGSKKGAAKVPVMESDVERLDDQEAQEMANRKKQKRNVKSKAMKQFVSALKAQFGQNKRSRKQQGMLQRLLNEETESSQLTSDQDYENEATRRRHLPSAKGKRVWATILKKSADSKKIRKEIFIQGKKPEGSYSPVIGPAASGTPQRERLKQLDRKFREKGSKTKSKKKAADSTGSAGSTAGNAGATASPPDTASKAPRRIVVHLDVTIPRRDSNVTEVRVQGRLETRQGDMPNELQAINQTLNGKLGRICVTISRPPKLLHSALFNSACGASLGVGNSTEDIVIFDRQDRAVGRNRDGYNVSATLRLTPEAAQNQDLELQRCLQQARGSGKGLEAALSFAVPTTPQPRSIPYCVSWPRLSRDTEFAC